MILRGLSGAADRIIACQPLLKNRHFVQFIQYVAANLLELCRRWVRQSEQKWPILGGQTKPASFLTIFMHI